jgi:hypothetical protein
MLSSLLIRRLMEQGRCLQSQSRLKDGEALVSQDAFPCLYQGIYHKEEADFLFLVCSTLPEIISADSGVFRPEIKRFIELVLRNGQIHKEEFLHRYLFEFWEEICVFPELMQLEHLFFKCQENGETNTFCKRLLAGIRVDGSNYPDMIGVSGGTSRTVYVLEVKNEALDDRALGQILRYYYVVRTACDRLLAHGQVKRVRPVLIVPSGDLAFWDAVPFHFREVLDILFWRISSNGAVELVDGQAILRRLSGGRLLPAV